MKNTAHADIRNLYRKFGGDAGNYQEIQQEYMSDRAHKNWPIVQAMEKARTVVTMVAPAPAHHAAVPSGAKSGLAQTDRQAAKRAVISTINPVVMNSQLPAQGQVTLSSPRIRAVQAHRSVNDPLSVVFSRLLNPKIHNAESSQKKTLRSVFGFLN